MTLVAKLQITFQQKSVLLRIALKEKGVGTTVQAWAADGTWSKASLS